ncbi:actin-binding protein WASF3 [Anopheles ziemanni]|uniref:actin-binding protein WASF3 n=1 Tax=Anopheles coustani TaxID=139045 RepID=UPI002658EA87|nr:actin-binding protein WASF3 [Anopheles coustani]XP_058124728.1 actin-binding protein WASF3 [Anopheles coustani]XP_058124729.1 actin-binding protein WASF3 [Anopheles coustani]XP_058124730.1 actin-binding protein WASF3 [Anopheles coustani]XP_058124731.1 actin-binding protein WASF3 [Anopheles coustani]XP_058124732.1 actin-binding protein WASF3 [Anopheles coustani]XP_058124733.1 actin-binding protein WASF3 [Anopheles coustani]XP_058124734.1 actin-binding protein WASF3 [Anopheles coustani]XP_
MPLPKRLVQPVFVARSVYVREELPAELETVTNTTLTNIVRQLSSLSKHAEDLFGELARDAGGLAERANSLQARIDRLAIKVTQLDSTVEEVSLQDIQLKKAFKSATMFDQQIFSRATMPSAMLEVYKACDKPPPLDKLNCYRDDGKDGLKFYTDPNYFFELWRQEMLKDTERVMHDRGKKVHKPRADGGADGGGGRQKKRPRAPHNTREKQRQRAIGHGETLMPNNVIYRTPNAIPGSNEEAIYNSAMAAAGGSMIYDSRSSSAMGGSSGAARPNSIELRRSYQQPNSGEMVDGSGVGYAPPSPGGGGYHQQQMPPHLQNQMVSNQHPNSIYQQQQQPIYTDQYGNPSLYGSSLNQNSQESLYAPGTPSRSKSRPSQPPPAPPSSGSGGGTPNASNANTPTRSRSLSTGRDNLPPPPPIPEGLQSPPHTMANGGTSVAAKLLLNRSGSRSGSPQLGMTGGPGQAQQHQQHQQQQVVVQSMMDQNQLALAQLNQQINNLNNLNMQLNQMSMNDLPPPPPIPEQLSPKQSPPNVAPPPPPPPPPMLDGPLSPSKPPLANGDLYNMPKMHQLKKIPPQEKITYDDPRSDLMKAIRDGIKLRKVEKQNHEAKENDRNKGLHDVASILARRVAIELSESESSESDDDSEGWQETNETSA